LTASAIFVTAGRRVLRDLTIGESSRGDDSEGVASDSAPGASTVADSLDFGAVGRPVPPAARPAFELEESSAALALPDADESPVVSASAMPGVTARAAPTPNVTTPALSHGCPEVCLRVNLLRDEFFLAVPATVYPSFGVSDG
jgi:hypothetical protein